MSFFRKRDPPPSGPGVKRLTPKAAVCFTTPAMTRRAADWLGRLGGCRPLAILSDDFDDVVWNCEAERADLLVLEMDFSNGVEDKDVSGRCDIAAAVRKRRPGCRVYLVCEEGHPEKLAALDKAVELRVKEPDYPFGDTICRFSFGNGRATINGQRYQGEFGTDHLGRTDTGKLIFKNISILTVPKGVEVSGTVKSYGSASEDVTVTLLQGTSVIGSPQVLTGASGSAPYSQTYSFAAVPAGDYTLKVEKKGHAPFTKEITVGDSNVTEDVTVYLIGDVNGDGKIDANDMQRIYAHISGENKFSNLAQGDVNGDGKVDANDMQRIYAHISGENPLS